MMRDPAKAPLVFHTDPAASGPRLRAFCDPWEVVVYEDTGEWWIYLRGLFAAHGGFGGMKAARGAFAMLQDHVEPKDQIQAWEASSPNDIVGVDVKLVHTDDNGHQHIGNLPITCPNCSRMRLNLDAAAWVVWCEKCNLRLPAPGPDET